jgi:hypothetical protein
MLISVTTMMTGRFLPIDLPLYAVQRFASGQWLVRTPSEESCSPAVVVVAVAGEFG